MGQCKVGNWETKPLGIDSNHLWRAVCVALTWSPYVFHLFTLVLLWRYPVDSPDPRVLKRGAGGEDVAFMVWEEKLVLLQVLWWETYLEEHFPSVPGTPNVLSKLIGVWRMLCGWGRVAYFGDYKIFKALYYLKLLPFCLTEGSPGKKYALTLPRWGKIPGQLLGDPSLETSSTWLG